jgi:hypothetical protein
MSLTRSDLQVIGQLVRSIVKERTVPIGIAAHVTPGNYTPEDGTMVAQIDDADAAYQLAVALGDDPQYTWPLSHPRVSVMSSDPNDQYGPRGGEPVMLIPTQRGYVAKFIPDAAGGVAPGNGPFFSVQAPAGERWITHRNADGTIDSGVQLTNDGPTEGDGLGGTTVGYQGALTQSVTKAGNSVALNDTEQTIATTTAGGMTDVFDDVAQTIKRMAAADLYTIVDAAGNAISHVVPTGGGVGLGALFSGLPSTAGAINNAILTTFGSNINSANLQTLINLAHAMVTAGIPNAGSLIPLIVASLIQNVSVPAGSSIVRVAS